MATYDLAYPGAAIDAILNTAYFLQEAGYIFQGSASEYSGTPSKRVWLIAPAGFSGLGLSSAVPKGSIGVCLYNGTAWVGKVINVVTIDSSVSGSSNNAVSSSAVYAAINQLATGVAEALDNLTFTDATPSSFLGDYINMKVSTTDNGVERILTYFTILAATTSKAGLLSAADKAKLDAILGNLRSLEIDDTTAYADLGDKIVESIKATIGGTEETISTFQILAATASKAGLLSAADKAKLDAILGNLRSLEIDDTTAYADLGDKIVESIKATIGGTEETISTFQILAATASKAGLLSAADKAKLDALWSSGYQFAGIATPSTTPISTTSKIFYIATEAGTYFNAVTVTQGINIIYKSGDTWSVAQVVGIDNEPTAGSDRLVKSGGVFGELALGAVYDVSAKNPTAGPNSNGKWESLSALLSDANLNTLIPTSVRKGGMSIKYVQSSDNKYVQYRLMSDEWSTTVADWQGVDDEPTIGSDNLVKSGGVQKELNDIESKYGSKKVFAHAGSYFIGDFKFIQGKKYKIINNLPGIFSASTRNTYVGNSSTNIVQNLGSIGSGASYVFVASADAPYFGGYGSGSGTISVETLDADIDILNVNSSRLLYNEPVSKMLPLSSISSEVVKGKLTINVPCVISYSFVVRDFNGNFSLGGVYYGNGNDLCSLLTSGPSNLDRLMLLKRTSNSTSSVYAYRTLQLYKEYKVKIVLNASHCALYFNEELIHDFDYTPDNGYSAQFRGMSRIASRNLYCSNGNIYDIVGTGTVQIPSDNFKETDVFEEISLMRGERFTKQDASHVLWEDGTVGNIQSLLFDENSLGLKSYVITYKDYVITQPTIVYNSEHEVTSYPELVITNN